MTSRHDDSGIGNVLIARIRELRHGNVTHARADGTLSTFDMLMIVAAGIMGLVAVPMLLSGTWSFDTWAEKVPAVLLVVALGAFLLSPKGAGEVLRNVPTDMFRPDGDDSRDKGRHDAPRQDMLGR